MRPQSSKRPKNMFPLQFHDPVSVNRADCIMFVSVAFMFFCLQTMRSKLQIITDRFQLLLDNPRDSERHQLHLQSSPSDDTSQTWATPFVPPAGLRVAAAWSSLEQFILFLWLGRTHEGVILSSPCASIWVPGQVKGPLHWFSNSFVWLTAEFLLLSSAEVLALTANSLTSVVVTHFMASCVSPPGHSVFG